MATRTELTAEEIGRRGKAIYEERLREQVEPGNVGRYLSLDIDSGEYEIGDDRLETLDRLSTRLPNAEIYTVLIGYPAAGAIGTGLRPIKDTV
jgi:hypothetical protein